MFFKMISTIKIKAYKENFEKKKCAHTQWTGLVRGLGIAKKQTWQEVNKPIHHFFF